MIRSLDLFSGIGGFSLAFRGVFETVAYCEIDQRCRNVLACNMVRGRIDTAPVLTDIRAITAASLSGLPEIRVITAGSPCQDISRANRFAAGIDGPKSRLMFEVFRVAKLIPSLDFILLENSPMITSRGLDRVAERARDMGWSAVWSTFDSREVGALHCRRRWFCLLKRPGAGGLLSLLKPPEPMPVTAEPVRVVRVHKDTTRRNALLGNSVVPQTAYKALFELVRVQERPRDAIVNGLGEKTCRCRVAFQSPRGALSTVWRSCVLRPHSEVKVRMSQGATLIERSPWATPTASRWNRTARLTQRQATTHLAVQIQFDEDTRRQAQRVYGTSDMLEFNVNPEFVEWLMGFPVGYTGAAVQPEV